MQCFDASLQTIYLFSYFKKKFIHATVLSRSIHFLHNKLRLKSRSPRVNDQGYDKLLMLTKSILN